MEGTIAYYNQNAQQYCEKTVNVPMQNVYDQFERYLEPGCKVLDLGCGSGRDSKYFLSKGYDVVSIDGAIDMCQWAENYLGKHVRNLSFEELDYTNEFDAVWASASLLHVNSNSINCIIGKICQALKKNGILYSSWKYGSGERVVAGKYYLDLDEARVIDLFKSNLMDVEYLWITEDNLLREERWLNAIVKKRG